MTDQADKNELRIVGDIEEVPDFDKLYEILRKRYQAGNIVDQIARIREDLEDSRREGEMGKLTPERIKRFMIENQSLKIQILSITRKKGLRVKVIKLAIKEVMEKKGGIL